MESDGSYSHAGNCSNPKCEACAYHRGFAEGRKAERERCARIADGLLDLEVGDVVGESIATKIRGGQDAK